jgi:sugar transferase (PEP-CTERM system associated)
MIRLFKVFVPTTVIALLISETLLAFGCYLLSAYYLFINEVDLQAFLFDDQGLARIATVTGILILGMYFQDLYNEFHVRSRVLLIQQLLFVIGAAFIAQALVAYLRRDWQLPKWLMIVGSALVFVVLFLWRMLYSSSISKVMGSQRILFLGSSPIVFEISGHLNQRPQLGLLPVGYLDEEDSPAQPSKLLNRLGNLGNLRQIVNEIRPDRIVVGMKERRERLPVPELLELRFAGLQTEDIATLYEATMGRVCSREIRPSQLIFSTELGPRRHSFQIQRLYSIVIAAIGIILSLPVMAIVALLVRLTSPGPILIRQTRVGLHNKPFTLYKFRSMFADAESRTGAVWAQRNDPRITPLGYWLRRLRLDEIPQLFNVARGEMSLVGPRPERPEFVATLSEQIPYYRQRHCVMPGITGWAQINYKYGDTIEDTIVKLEYDLYYIKHISPMLDLYIVFHTVKTMLLFRGAQ